MFCSTTATSRPGPPAGPTRWTAAPKVNTFEGWDIVNTTVDAHRVLVPFGATASLGEANSAFAWHCHILEHEENDMMQGYTIRS